MNIVNRSGFYDLVKEIRRTLKCKQEMAEYLAALQQWTEYGISSDAVELKRKQVSFMLCPKGNGERPLLGRQTSARVRLSLVRQ